MVELWRDIWIRETGKGQQVAQLHDTYYYYYYYYYYYCVVFVLLWWFYNWPLCCWASGLSRAGSAIGKKKKFLELPSKGGPACGKVWKKKGRKHRTQDGRWPQVPSTLEHRYLSTSDTTEKDKIMCNILGARAPFRTAKPRKFVTASPPPTAPMNLKVKIQLLYNYYSD